MKYVRTKNGIYNIKDTVRTRDEKKLLNYDGKFVDILKQADTIKELCDRFIFIYTDTETGETKFGTAYDNWIKDKDYIKEYSKYPLYGMIWVFGEKGEPTLKPVAKYNKEKGEFKLL